jgi:DNA-binding NarL/FixJ family response regulator
MVRNELRGYLQSAGYEVIAEAGDTLQALSLFRAVSPALVMVDTAIPQTGGIGALALLRIILNEDAAVRVLVIGRRASPEVRRSFLAEGAVDYLIKPSQGQGFDCMCKRLTELLPQLTSISQAPQAA